MLTGGSPDVRSSAWVGGASAGYYLLGRLPGTSAPVALAQIPGGTLDPTQITKYAAAADHPAGDAASLKAERRSTGVDDRLLRDRRAAVRAADPAAELPATTVWSYGSADHPGTFNYPAFTIEATVDRPVRVKWINDLVDADGGYLPAPAAGRPDAPLGEPARGAHGSGRARRRDQPSRTRARCRSSPTCTAGTSSEESDGFAEAWYLPDGEEHPRRATRGSGPSTRLQGEGRRLLSGRLDARQRRLRVPERPEGVDALVPRPHPGDDAGQRLRGPGRLLPAPRRPATDDGALPGPAPHSATARPVLRDPPGDPGPLLQRRRLALLPGQPAFFEGLDPDQLQIPFIPDEACDGESDISPIWNPEFFGNTMVVNGQTWPFLEVEQRRYRFRFLNGCNSRFLILKLEQRAAVLADRRRGRLPARAGGADAAPARARPSGPT